MRYPTIQLKDVLWLTDLGKKLNLFDEKGYLLQNKNIDFNSLNIVCNDLYEPDWRPKTIKELFQIEDDESERKRIFLKLESLIDNDLVTYLNKKEFQNLTGVNLPLHGKFNLYYPTAKGIIINQILTTFPICAHAQLPFYNGEEKFLLRSSVISDLYADLEKQKRTNNFIIDRYNGDPLKNNLLENLLNDIFILLDNNPIRFCNSITPLMYYLNEHFLFHDIFYTFDGAFPESNKFGRSGIREYLKNQYKFFKKMITKFSHEDQRDDLYLFYWDSK